MDTLINELTLYAKIDTNRIPVYFCTLSVNDYFNDCAEDIEMELDSKNVSLVISIMSKETRRSLQIRADKESDQQHCQQFSEIHGTEQGLINLRVKDVGDFIQVRA